MLACLLPLLRRDDPDARFLVTRFRFVNRDDIDFGLAHDLPAVQTVEMVRDCQGIEVSFQLRRALCRFFCSSQLQEG